MMHSYMRSISIEDNRGGGGGMRDNNNKHGYQVQDWGIHLDAELMVHRGMWLC